MADDHPILSGTPEEKIKSWLEVQTNEDGHIKQGDWMNVLIPHLSLNSINKDPVSPSITFNFTVQPDHCNRLQNLHGGCSATLFDFCTTLPLALVNRPGFWQFMGVSRTLSVTYLRPVPTGTPVLIECEIVHIGKRLASLKGTMKRKEDGAVVATCAHEKVNIDPEPKL